MFTRSLVLIAVVLSAVISAVRPAHAQTIDPAVRADVEKLMDITGMRANTLQIANIMATQMQQALRRTNVGLPDRAAAIALEVFTRELGLAFEGPDGLC